MPVTLTHRSTDRVEGAPPMARPTDLFVPLTRDLCHVALLAQVCATASRVAVFRARRGRRLPRRVAIMLDLAAAGHLHCHPDGACVRIVAPSGDPVASYTLPPRLVQVMVDVRGLLARTVDDRIVLTAQGRQMLRWWLRTRARFNLLTTPRAHLGR